MTLTVSETQAALKLALKERKLLNKRVLAARRAHVEARILEHFAKNERVRDPAFAWDGRNCSISFFEGDEAFEYKVKPSRVSAEKCQWFGQSEIFIRDGYLHWSSYGDDDDYPYAVNEGPIDPADLHRYHRDSYPPLHNSQKSRYMKSKSDGVDILLEILEMIADSTLQRRVFEKTCMPADPANCFACQKALQPW